MDVTKTLIEAIIEKVVDLFGDKAAVILNRDARTKAALYRLFADLTDFQGALDELERKGFIVLVRRGRWLGRKASEWRVTDQGCNGHFPTRDWTRWQRGADLRAPRPDPESETMEALAAAARAP